jgi:DNA invertase Pin-like site-specific DNA recombinase
MIPKSGKSLAAIYVRQSRHKEGERTTSPEVQESKCRELASVAACDSVEVFRDLDVSGKSMKGRKALLALIERIKAGDVSVVAAYDQSRTFRSTRDALEFYALVAEPKYQKVDVQFVHGRFDRSAVGEFTYTSIAAAHAMERRMVSEKRADTDARKAERGEARGMAPYGYRWHEGGWIVDDAEAAVVRRIFAEYAESSTSAKALAAKLNAEAIPRPGNRSDHGWLPDTVVDTLRRVAYVGKTYAKANRQGDLITAQWPAIVEQATFDTVRDLMDRRKVQARRPTPASYIFGRLLVCSRCGGIMRATRNYGHSYYHCRRDVGDRCTSPAVREDVLLSWAGALFLRIAERIGHGLTITTKAPQRKASPPPTVSSVQRSIDELELRRIRGHGSPKMYDAEESRLLQRLEQAMIAELVPSPEAIPTNWKAMFTDWQQADSAMQRRTLNRLFEALWIEDGSVVSYKPRTEQRATIERVIEQVTKTAFSYSVPLTGRGTNLTRGARTERRKGRLSVHVSGERGKGGIRTLEGALHPLPA